MHQENLSGCLGLYYPIIGLYCHGNFVFKLLWIGNKKCGVKFIRLSVRCGAKSCSLSTSTQGADAKAWKPLARRSEAQSSLLTFFFHQTTATPTLFTKKWRSTAVREQARPTELFDGFSTDELSDTRIDVQSAHTEMRIPFRFQGSRSATTRRRERTAATAATRTADSQTGPTTTWTVPKRNTAETAPPSPPTSFTSWSALSRSRITPMSTAARSSRSRSTFLKSVCRWGFSSNTQPSRMKRACTLVLRNKPPKAKRTHCSRLFWPISLVKRPTQTSVSNCKF